MSKRTDIRITLDSAKIANLLSVTTDASAARAASRVRDRAKLYAPRSSGALAASITMRKARAPSTVQSTYLVGSNLKYAGFQEYGIGPVHARKGGVLRFRPKGSTMYIFRPRTRGFAGRHYLRKAYHSLTLQDYLP